MFREAVVLVPDRQLELAELLQRLRGGVRAGLARPGAPAERHDDQHFRAHVSVAYANGSASVASIRAALAGQPTMPVEYLIREVSLIRMHRDHRQYEWEVVATAELGG